MSLRIGFAGTYYTLWEVNTNISYNGAGLPFETVDYFYLNNLSTDLVKAQQKALEKGAKDLEPDNELRGKTRNWSSKKRLYSTIANGRLPFFGFGKYDNKLFSEVDDQDYMLWYWRETNNEHLAKVLVKNGVLVKTKDGYVTSKAMEQIQMRQQALSGKTTGDVVEIEVLSNCKQISEDVWAIQVKDIGNVILAKDIKMKMMDYKGFEYFVPLVDGAGMRIKNKTVKAVLNKDGIIEKFVR